MSVSGGPFLLCFGFFLYQKLNFPIWTAFILFYLYKHNNIDGWFFFRLTLLPLIVGWHGDGHEGFSCHSWLKNIYMTIQTSKMTCSTESSRKGFFSDLNTVEIKVWFLTCYITELVFWNDEILTRNLVLFLLLKEHCPWIY